MRNEHSANDVVDTNKARDCVHMLTIGTAEVRADVVMPMLCKY